MAQVLKLTRDVNNGQIIAAEIDSLRIADLRSVVQNLQSGSLQATITANFTEVLIEDGVVGPIPAPAMSLTFQPGTAAGSTKVTISEGLPSGASFKYTLLTAPVVPPMIGDDAEQLLGTLTTYTQGTDIIADPGMIVAMTIIDSAGGFVKFTQHTLSVGDVTV